MKDNKDVSLKKEKLTEYNLLQDRLNKRIAPLFGTQNASKIKTQLKNGKTQYLKYQRIENTTFDPKWIEMVEDCMPKLDSIIKNPKKTTENVTEVVPIELARKTNAESVKHLTTHSQFIKDIDENGNVVPNKILNIRNDDFYATYENRFIATLIRKLVLFVEKRYLYMLSCTEMKETQLLFMKNKCLIDGKEVEIETKVKVTNEANFEGDQERISREYLKRVEEVRTYLHYYYNSDFMKKLKTEKNVRNPILMTNILRKNKDYNKCLQLYKFIEHYDALGISVKVNDKYSVLSEEGLEEINNALLVDFLALRSKETTPKEVKEKKYSPKLLPSIDDELFVYGDYIKGPLSFVRTDEGYLKYLEETKRELPLHPTKKEREYFADEYQTNKDLTKEKNETEKLLSRKKKEAIQSNKMFEKVVLEREREELEAKRLEEERKINAKLDEIEKARKLLTGEAEPIIEDEPVVETIKTEETPKVEEAPAVEAPVKEEKPKPEKKPAAPKKKAPAKKTVSEPKAKVVEKPEEKPVEAPKVEEAPAVEAPVKEEKPKPEKKPAPKKKAPAKKKPAKKPEEKAPEKPKEAPREAIPGRFIVKTYEGYYVSKDKYSDDKRDAHIFLDFNLANDLKKQKGGKVIKL